MNTSDSLQDQGAALPTNMNNVAPRFGRRFTMLLLIGSVFVVAGTIFGWSWLVALGIAPVLLSVLPCVAMCALGLCMNHITRQPSGKEQASPEQRTGVADSARSSGKEMMS